MDQFIRAYGDIIVAMFFWAMLALSLYLPLMTGQLSLASPGFYAVGGYVAAIMSTKLFPVPPMGQLIPIWEILIEMAAAAVICAGLAIIVGIPALRLHGIYLALATIAFVEVLRILSQTLDITGQSVGIFGIPQPFDTRIQYLLFVVPMLLIVMFFVARLERSRVGRAFLALREDELAASAMGINPTRYKVLAFTLGAVLAGIVGAVSAHFLNTWNPRQGTFDASILILAFVLIGGSRSYLGPVVGGMVLTALPEALRQLSSIQGLPTWTVQFLLNGRLIIFGLLIALSTRFFPQGLITPDIFTRKEATK